MLPQHNAHLYRCATESLGPTIFDCPGMLGMLSWDVVLEIGRGRPAERLAAHTVTHIHHTKQRACTHTKLTRLTD